MTGQYFGASGITDEKPREYSAVVSVSDTRLLSLHKEVISSYVLFPTHRPHFRSFLRL